MTNYDEILEEAITKMEILQRATASEYIPRMYHALRCERLLPDDARDRIEKDCVGIWSKRTILDALPDEAKDLKKQKAGRLRQKKVKSAALPAATRLSIGKKEQEIIINTQGKPTENDKPPLSSSLTPFPSTSTSDNPCLSSSEGDLLAFEFTLQSRDIFEHMILSSVNIKESIEIWFHGILDKHTGKVISADIGRITSQQNTIE